MFNKSENGVISILIINVNNYQKYYKTDTINNEY